MRSILPVSSGPDMKRAGGYPRAHASSRTRRLMRAGILQAAAAYVIWGLFPLYFRLLQGVLSTRDEWYNLVIPTKVKRLKLTLPSMQ